MPNVIVNSCYIKDSQHFINYLEYAGQKLEAQTLVLNDGSKIEVNPDELVDIEETPDFRYVQLEMKDGTIRRLGCEKYRSYVEERKESLSKVTADKNFPEEELQYARSAEKYLDYIAFRPSVEKNPNLSHGLFGINGAADMLHAKNSVLENENSYKWSHIISLTREGAETTGFDNRAAWENLIISKAYDIGKLYNIPPEHLEIYAAYHDKAHHPHCHLFFWSNANTTAEGCAGFNDGDLIKKSEKLRSIFNNEIFKDEISYLKNQKQQFRKEMSENLKKLVLEIGETSYRLEEEIIVAFSELADSLNGYTGRAYYMYLSPDNKQKVNEFLRTVIKSDNNLNAIYKKILENQRAFISMYNDDIEKINSRMEDFEEHFFNPNSKNDMRTLHNIIIEQVMLFNRNISYHTTDIVVRKNKSFEQSNQPGFDNKTNNSENNNSYKDYKGSNQNDFNYEESYSEHDQYSKDNNYSKQNNKSNQKTVHKTSIDKQSAYAASLLLSKLAYAMSSFAMQYSLHKQSQQDAENEQKEHPKFASKNHQLTKSHLTVQTPISR